MYWIVLFYFPVVFFGVFHFGSIPRQPVWNPGSCSVISVETGFDCDGYSISWNVSFCAEFGCTNGSNINTTIRQCMSSINAMNSSIANHPLYSRSKCYYNAPALEAFWARGIDWTVTWSRVGFYISLAWIVVSFIPIVNRTIVACRLALFYRTRPPSQDPPRALPAQIPGGREEPLQPSSSSQESEEDDDEVSGTSISSNVKDLLEASASCDIDAPDVCQICFAHRVDSRLVPCGHEFACSRCAKFCLRTLKECALCRSRVERIDKIERDVEKDIQVDTNDSPVAERRNEINFEARLGEIAPDSL